MIRVRTPAGVVTLVVALAGGCGSGVPPATLPPPASSSPPGPTPVQPTSVVEPVPDAPPDVVLVAEGRPAVVGDLGTFSWDGLVSDSPWILGTATVSVAPGESFEALVAGTLPVRDWTARWARVVGNDAQPVEDGADAGPGLPITLRPPSAGAWSLRVELRYADVGRAAWYWRVEVAP